MRVIGEQFLGSGLVQLFVKVGAAQAFAPRMGVHGNCETMYAPRKDRIRVNKWGSHKH